MILLLFLWRLLLFIPAWYATTHFPYTPRFPYSDLHINHSGLPLWIARWANFDGVHYLTIAKIGYQAQFTQAFFPLYPLTIRLVGTILSDKYLIVSGLLISFFAFTISIILLRKLLLLDFSKDIVNNSIFFLFIFPTSFYFGAIYTESFFLLFSISAFYFLRTKRLWLSSLCVGLASATRINGILLIPALLIEQYQQLKIKKKFDGKLFLKSATTSPITYIGPLGLISYMIYLGITFKDPLYFWHAQGVFGAARESSRLILPVQVVWRYLKILTTVSTRSNEFFVALWEFLSMVIAVSLLLIAHKKKMKFSYILFGWLTLLLPMLSGTLSSFPRYILFVLPIYIVLGSIKSKLLFCIVASISILLLLTFITNFIRGLWVA